MSQQPISVLGMHIKFATIAAPTIFTEIEECLGLPETDDSFGEKEYMTISDTRKQKGTKAKDAPSFTIECNYQKAADVAGQEALMALKGEELWIEVSDDEGTIDTFYFRARYFGAKRPSTNADDDMVRSHMFAQLSDTQTVAPA